MEIPEPIDKLNSRLAEHFGLFENGQPNWRIVWGDDQLEKRLIDCTPEGVQLLFPEVREVPKYWYQKHCYWLERLVPVPFQNEKELGTKLSYEPIYVFADVNDNPLPVKWEVVVILIKTLLDQQTYNPVPYKLPEGEGSTTEELNHKAAKLSELLYGNETSVGDALAYGDGVGYTTSKLKIN